MEYLFVFLESYYKLVAQLNQNMFRGKSVFFEKFSGILFAYSWQLKWVPPTPSVTFFFFFWAQGGGGGEEGTEGGGGECSTAVELSCSFPLVK